MSIDDIKNGQRIVCNGVNGTVIGKRSTRRRRLVLVKMDNGFTLTLNAHMFGGITGGVTDFTPDAADRTAQFLKTMELRQWSLG